MASGLYDSARSSFLTGGINWTSDTIKVVGVDISDYTVDLSAHQNLSSIPSGARVATSSALTNPTAAAGVADADDATFPAATGDTISAVVIYKQGGSDSTSPLIAYIEVGPVTPNGADIVLVFDSGANRIFKL